jgi:hypothetical protein
MKQSKAASNYASALSRNLITGARAGFQITGVDLETPLLFSLLHDARMDDKTENNGAKKLEFEARFFFVYLLCVSFIFEKTNHLIFTSPLYSRKPTISYSLYRDFRKPINYSIDMHF